MTIEIIWRNKERNLAGLPLGCTRIRPDGSGIEMEIESDAESICEDGYPHTYKYDYPSVGSGAGLPRSYVRNPVGWNI